LRLDGVETREEDGTPWKVVTLSFNGEPVVGRHSVGDDDPRTAIRAVALATLDAVEQFVSSRFTCELQEVDRVHALGKELVVLLINMSFEDRQVQLFGSCRVGDNVVEAAAKAALDATNRYVDITLNS
jgi:hypothetical protein